MLEQSIKLHVGTKYPLNLVNMTTWLSIGYQTLFMHCFFTFAPQSKRCKLFFHKENGNFQKNCSVLSEVYKWLSYNSKLKNFKIDQKGCCDFLFWSWLIMCLWYKMVSIYTTWKGWIWNVPTIGEFLVHVHRQHLVNSIKLRQMTFTSQIHVNNTWYTPHSKVTHESSLPI